MTHHLPEALHRPVIVDAVHAHIGVTEDEAHVAERHLRIEEPEQCVLELRVRGVPEIVERDVPTDLRRRDGSRHRLPAIAVPEHVSFLVGRELAQALQVAERSGHDRHLALLAVLRPPGELAVHPMLADVEIALFDPDVLGAKMAHLLAAKTVEAGDEQPALQIELGRVGEPTELLDAETAAGRGRLVLHVLHVDERVLGQGRALPEPHPEHAQDRMGETEERFLYEYGWTEKIARSSVTAYQAGELGAFDNRRSLIP